MVNIRHGVFETNSSSTHSICISKQKINKSDLKGKKINFRLGEYGWEREWVSPSSYLYTAIMYLKNKKLLDKVKELLDELGVEYTFEEADDEPDVWPWNYYIDHAEDLEPLLESLYNDEDLLIRYLFGDTDVFTGNDNDYDDDNDNSKIARPYIWDSNKHECVQNPRLDTSKYDYYYKGN